MPQIFLATNNEGKIERFKKLLESTGLVFEICTPKSFGLESLDIKEDGKTLLKNAEIKAQAYWGKVNMPILANDTGFYVKGEGFVVAPKRKALGVDAETSLTKEEVAKRLVTFWQTVAGKHGGQVDAAWVDAFVLLMPDGRKAVSESRREVILTDKVFGIPHIQMPVRSLYVSKTTSKPSVQHTHEEEILELKPVTDALCELINDLVNSDSDQ